MNEKLSALKRLVEIVERLRAPGGCPWDREQTLVDMGRHMLEEVSEVVDAIEDSRGEASPQICEELGDLLMNIVLAARIAEESSPSEKSHPFGLVEVAENIAEKLVRRHPHVFGDCKVEGVDEVLANWNAIKAEERKNAPEHARKGSEKAVTSRLDAVPRSLPPLVRAFELGRAAARAGFDWPDVGGAFEKVEEELEEVRSVLFKGGRRCPPPPSPPRGRPQQGAEKGEDGHDEALQAELGDLLFAVVNLCRKSTVRPETALRRSLRKFYQRFHAVEERLGDLEAHSLEEMEEVWQKEKRPGHMS